MRRDMPCKPRMCMGPKVRLNPTSMSQKFQLPSRSSSM